MVDLAKVILRFFRNESCGKCTPCRIGTLQLYEIVSRISEGQGKLSDLDSLVRISEAMSEVSNCGLGQTAPTALLDILKYFRSEVETHIVDHVCPTGVCTALKHSLVSAPVE